MNIALPYCILFGLVWVFGELVLGAGLCGLSIGPMFGTWLCIPPGEGALPPVRELLLLGVGILAGDELGGIGGIGKPGNPDNGKPGGNAGIGGWPGLGG